MLAPSGPWLLTCSGNVNKISCPETSGWGRHEGASAKERSARGRMTDWPGKLAERAPPESPAAVA